MAAGRAEVAGLSGCLAACPGAVSYTHLYYTYNVKIVSVDKIIIEVDSSKKTEEDERRPGAEGDVVMALQIKELDAYNEVFTLSFHQSNVDETMTWDVNTPFSRGAAGEHPADYKWIKFRINSKNSSNFYSSTDFRAYPGNDAVYTCLLYTSRCV